MALRILPFGAFEGFSDLAVAGTHYYSQGFTPSLFGMGTMYSIVNKANSGVITGMGNIKNYALANGAMYAQDDNGNILKETTPGAYDFAIARSPGGNGAGLLGDQKGRLIYAQNAAIGKYDGSWSDSWQSVNSGVHPMDTYEDLIVIGNMSSVAVIFSDDSFNGAALSLPSGMTVTAVKSGPTGILIGANFGYQGAIILWDGNALRAKTPWKWFKGQILSIEKYGEVWIVKTQRGVFETNGYTVKQIFGVFDDPLSFKGYDNSLVLPQQMTVVNDIIIFSITSVNGGPTYEFGKMKPGIYLYSLSRHAWNYIPVGTGSTISLNIFSVFTDINYNNRILIGYRDVKAGVNYIATLINTPPTRATFVSEVIGIGRPHYQRVFFGPTDKTAEACVLNLQPLNSMIDPATLTFNVALKVYNFKRQLWGKAITNNSVSPNNIIRVDGTSSANYDAQIGDEVTILQGTNAGQVAHITAIANDGASNEAWTLDTTLTGQTENNIYVQVQPYVLVKKQTFTGLTSLKNIFWSINSVKGKQFLAKFVLDGMGSNLAVELMTSYFVFNDIGYDQT
jgi:hypothetical protein